MATNKLNIQIGERIRQLRLVQGKGQTEIAQALNISVAALSKIENGLTDLNISRLAQIASFFKVSIAEIIAKDQGNLPQHLVVQLESLNDQLIEKENEIAKLRKKVIELYEKLGL